MCFNTITVQSAILVIVTMRQCCTCSAMEYDCLPFLSSCSLYWLELIHHRLVVAPQALQLALGQPLSPAWPAQHFWNTARLTKLFKIQVFVSVSSLTLQWSASSDCDYLAIQKSYASRNADNGLAEACGLQREGVMDFRFSSLLELL